MKLTLLLLGSMMLSAPALAADPALRLDIERASIEERLDRFAPSSPLVEQVVARQGMRFLCVFVHMSVQWQDERQSLVIPSGEVFLRWEDGQDVPLGHLDRGMHLFGSRLKNDTRLGRPAVFHRRKLGDKWEPRTTWRLQLVFAVPEDVAQFELQIGDARVAFEAEPGQLPEVADMAQFSVREPLHGDYHDAPWEVQGQTLRGRLWPIEGAGKLLSVEIEITPRMANWEYADSFLLMDTDLALRTDGGAVCRAVTGFTPALIYWKEDEWPSQRSRFLFVVPEDAQSAELLFHGRAVAEIDLPTMAETDQQRQADGDESSD